MDGFCITRRKEDACLQNMVVYTIDGYSGKRVIIEILRGERNRWTNLI